jgi:2-methylcitrate dehydratase PrpD
MKMPQPRNARFVGERLGQFVEASHWHALPQALRHEGKRSLLNFFGCAIGVASAPPIETAMRVLTRLSGAERVTVIGRAERLDPLGAAFINAVAGNLLDYDDTHLRTVIHPTAPVAPAALALAEQRRLSGAEVLHAFILGAESSAVSATASPLVIMREAGISLRHAGCSGLPSQAQSCLA